MTAPSEACCTRFSGTPRCTRRCQTTHTPSRTCSGSDPVTGGQGEGYVSGMKRRGRKGAVDSRSCGGKLSGPTLKISRFVRGAHLRQVSQSLDEPLGAAHAFARERGVIPVPVPPPDLLVPRTLLAPEVSMHHKRAHAHGRYDESRLHHYEVVPLSDRRGARSVARRRCATIACATGEDSSRPDGAAVAHPRCGRVVSQTRSRGPALFKNNR